jgi:hypothetical protein
MSASLGEKAVFYAGQNYVFTSVPYTGQVTTFTVDQGVGSAVVIDPSGGPAATIGATANGLTTISLAAGGGNIGGRAVVVTSYGKSRASFKPDVGNADL